jgi:calcium-translocating P-type ATPase
MTKAETAAERVMPVHALPPLEALAAVQSRAGGLTASEVAARRKLWGPNVLPTPAGKSLASVFVSQFRSPFIYLLLAAALVSLALREQADAAFIGIVLLTNAGIGTFQEWRAELRSRALRQLVHGYVTALRDGQPVRLEAEALVPGDIVTIETGLRVPADLRLLECRDLLVNESLLTGESMPVEKRWDKAIAPGCALDERSTMLHAGSSVIVGRGSGVVTATARRTELGRIAESLADQPSPSPPLMRQMTRLTRAMSLAMVGVIVLLAAIEASRGTPLAQIALVAIALAVAAIPEGLPVAMTVALSIAVHRMAARRVVVRNLPAVEGLGSCTLIAVDKTGTLTINRVTVDQIWLPGLGQRPANDPAARDLAYAAAVCNEAALGHAADGADAVGDTVDIAFMRQAAVFGVADAARRDEFAGAIAYEPELKFAAAFRRRDGIVHAYVKGAGEAVLAMCADVDPQSSAAADALAQDGYRVLAIAAGPVDKCDRSGLVGLRFLGFAALIDPLRPEAAGAVTQARQAGVDVRMITGDHPLTALALARRLGLARDPAALIAGSELARLQNDAFDAAVLGACVYARIEPLQKLAIVRSLQRSGHVVAMTGDGVNDAPALNAADIGVAMAHSGTDVARDAADILLVDDNFASIVSGIEEGRIAYDNLRKVIAMSISTGAAEIGLFVLAVLFDLPAPLTAIQLLWLNLVTNGLQDVALAFERGEPDTLRRRPRPPNQPLIDRRMVEQTVLAGAVIAGLSFALYANLLASGVAHVLAQNALLWLVVCFENAHALNCRSETRSLLAIPFAANPLLLLAIAGAQIVQVAAMYTPGLNRVLDLAPLPWQHWLGVAALALLIVPVMELYKAWRRKHS